MTERYIILTLADARLLANHVSVKAGSSLPDAQFQMLWRAVYRIQNDTGANIQDVVDQLLGAEACPACVIEGQQRSCIAWAVQGLGRRLRRLLERARHERPPGPGECEGCRGPDCEGCEKSPHHYWWKGIDSDG